MMNIPRFLALKPSHLLRLTFSIINIIFITLEGFYMRLGPQVRSQHWRGCLVAVALPDVASSCEGCGTGSSQGCCTAKGGRPWKKEIEGAPGAASFYGKGRVVKFLELEEGEGERAKQLKTCWGVIVWVTMNHVWASWVVRAVTERATPNEIAGVVSISSSSSSRSSSSSSFQGKE